MKQLVFTVIIGFLLVGCASHKEITLSESYLVTIKTPQKAVSDTGFLNFGKGYSNLQIFAAGTLLFNLEVDNSVCVDGQCASRTQFNTLFFNHEHYETLIDDILHMKPIYQKRNFNAIEGGFEQEIVLPNSAITYRVVNQTMTFKDRVNGILIRLKPLH